jgi:hypothetical protein
VQVLSEDKNNIEFKILEYKLVGSDTVTFKLEDGASVIVKVDLSRVGIAENFKNPDGTPHYNINIDAKLRITPPDGKYKISKSKIRSPPSPPLTDKRKYG